MRQPRVAWVIVAAGLWAGCLSAVCEGDACEQDASVGGDANDAGELDAGADAGSCASCPAGTFCDLAAQRCVTCNAAQGCTAPSFCDLGANGGAGACVTCTADAGCPGDLPVCDLSVAGGRCVHCTETKGCAGLAPACDLAVPSGRCVGCLSSAQCSVPTPVCDPASQRCVACLTNSDCAAPAGVCNPTTLKCVGCLTEAHCQNPTPLCESGSNRCVACTSSAQCATGKTCSPAGACEPFPESCATAQTVSLPAVSGQLAFDVDTSSSVDDHDGSCNSSVKGPEQVFKLTLPASVSVTITATRPAGSVANPVIFVRASPCASGAEIGCSDAPAAPSAVETLELASRPAGDYFLFVEGRGANVGPTHLVITVRPGNDGCAGAQPLAFVGDIATTSGNTAFADNSNAAGDPTPSCSSTASSSGKDLVYQYTLTAAHDVTVTATPSGTSPTFQPVLYVRKPGACGSPGVADELGCSSTVSEPQGAPASVALDNQQAGTYFVFVDGALDTSGPFTLDVSLAAPTIPPANDECAGAIALSFVGDIATASGDTRKATNSNAAGDQTPDCSPSGQSTGKDLVYSYTLTAAHDVKLTATPAAANPDYEPVIYVRKPGGCADASVSNEIACDSAGSTPSGTPAAVTLLNQQPGTYFVFVDGALHTSGQFVLDAVLSAPTLPPANDTCAGAATLTVGGPAVSGDTTQAADDYSSSSAPPYSSACSNWSFSGNDLVYQFTATATGAVNAMLVPSASFDGALLLLGSTCGAASCSGYADSALAGGTETLGISVNAGATYYLAVDSYSDSQASSSGTFTLSVQ